MKTFEDFFTFMGAMIMLIWSIALFGWWQSNIALSAAIKEKEKDRGCIYIPHDGHPIEPQKGMQFKDIDFPNTPCY